jgi:hypothetical protein
MTKLTLVGLAFVLAGGCVSASQPITGTNGTGGTLQVAIGQEFQLAVGQEARIVGTPITVTFRSVSDDSRCPSNVQCVWAGDAAIKLGLAANSTAQESTIHLNIDPKTVDFSGYRIKATNLAPVPKSGSTISAGAYIVTLQVSSP